MSGCLETMSTNMNEHTASFSAGRVTITEDVSNVHPVLEVTLDLSSNFDYRGADAACIRLYVNGIRRDKKRLVWEGDAITKETYTVHERDWQASVLKTKPNEPDKVGSARMKATSDEILIVFRIDRATGPREGSPKDLTRIAGGVAFIRCQTVSGNSEKREIDKESDSDSRAEAAQTHATQSSPSLRSEANESGHDEDHTARDATIGLSSANDDDGKIEHVDVSQPDEAERSPSDKDATPSVESSVSPIASSATASSSLRPPLPPVIDLTGDDEDFAELLDMDAIIDSIKSNLKPASKQVVIADTSQDGKLQVATKRKRAEPSYEMSGARVLNNLKKRVAENDKKLSQVDGPKPWRGTKHLEGTDAEHSKANIRYRNIVTKQVELSKLLVSLRDPSVAAEARNGLHAWEVGKVAEYEYDLDAVIAAAKEFEAEMGETAAPALSSSPPNNVDNNRLYPAEEPFAIVPKVRRSPQTSPVNTMASAAQPPGASETLVIDVEDGDEIEDVEHLQYELRIAQLAQSENEQATEVYMSRKRARLD